MFKLMKVYTAPAWSKDLDSFGDLFGSLHALGFGTRLRSTPPPICKYCENFRQGAVLPETHCSTLATTYLAPRAVARYSNRCIEIARSVLGSEGACEYNLFK